MSENIEKKQIRIFISYARADDEDFVKQLYKDLIEGGFDIWWDRKAMNSRGLTFLQEIRDAIEGSDRLIAVIGPNAVKSDYVKAEWEHGLLFAKAVIPILRLGDFDLIPKGIPRVHCPDFREDKPYKDALEGLVRILSEPVPGLGDFRSTPSLPPHFQTRTDEIKHIGEMVLADIQKPTVITSAKQTTAIVGMGGSGKSVLAAAFARATDTRRAFKDGVSWLQIGQNPDILSSMRLIGTGFKKDDAANYLDIETAKASLPKVLEDKVCLIVLDDIWNVNHVAPFRDALGPRCRLLITTRDGGLVTALGAQQHLLGMLTDLVAMRFLADWCEKDVSSLPAGAASVAKECGYLPFALALCGAMARDGSLWSDMLDALKDADIAFIKKQFPNYPYTNVLKSLKVSIDALAVEDPDSVKHYQELVVFNNHRSIPEAAIMTLWMHTDGLKERSARELLLSLKSKALLRLEGEAPNRFVTLHDLQHDYLRATAGDLKNLREKLLAAYQQKCKDGWAGGPNDGYFFENLAYHLVGAGKKDELSTLLFDFEWMHVKLEAVDINSLIKDYDCIPDDHNLRMVQGALRLSAHVLWKDKTQLQSQIYGRLMSQETLEIKSLLDQIMKWKDKPWIRTLSQSLSSPGGCVIRTLEGHTHTINAVAVFKEGKRVISGSKDKKLIVWDIESGEVLNTLEDHTNHINAVTVFQDDMRAISASSDCTLKVWDMENGKVLNTLKGHTYWVNAVAVFQDGKRAISASSDCTLKVWDMKNEKVLKTLEGHKSGVNAVVLFKDDKRAISASSDHTLKVWDMENGEVLKTLEGHKSGVNAVDVFQDGKRAISASWNSKIIVWNIESGEKLKTLEGHKMSVFAVDVFQDGKRAISASMDNTIIVWDIDSGKALNTLKNHTMSVNAVVIFQGNRAISGSSDKKLIVWNLENIDLIKRIEGHTGTIYSLAVFQNNKCAISASSDCTLKIWDIESRKVLKTLEGHNDAVYAVAVFQDDKRAISASQDKTLIVWDIESGKKLKTLNKHKFKVNAVAVFQDDSRAISASSDCMLKVWDIENEEVLKTLKDHTSHVDAVAVFQDGNRAISASTDCTLKIWDIDSEKVLKTLKCHEDAVNAVSVFQDDKRAISASFDKKLIVWDTESGIKLKTLEGHTDSIIDVALFMGDKFAVSVSYDNKLKIWDIENEKMVAEFVNEGLLFSCAASPDLNLIVAGDASGKVHFLRLEGSE